MEMAKTPQKSLATPNITYQLHIALEDIHPLIWRRLWVASNLTLVMLDRVFQAAMGWTNSHPHEFEIDGKRYGHIDDDWDQDESLLDERRRTIDALLAQDVAAFSYTYDFGDHWRHIVVVEKAMDSDEGNNWTQCIDGANAGPPEDVGGTGGYEEFVEAITDPEHEEHIAMRRWNGGPYDPRGFDVNAVNRELRRRRL